jgi:cell pole-organizing protein PopZ
MTQAAKAQEPSMEEILASIRRIIADDDVNKTAATSAPEPKPAPPPPIAMAPRPAAPARPVAVPPPDPAPVVQSEPQAQAEFEPADQPDQTPDADDHAGDILELTEEMRAPSAAASSFRTIDAQPDVIFSEAEQAASQEAKVEDQLEQARQQIAASMEEGSLLSSSASAAVDSAFNTLAQTVLVQNARTLEDLVREMLRPMLKSWLDDNLPGLVERLVRAEIERVSRGR